MASSQRQQFIAQVQVAMTELGQLADRATTLSNVFADRAYDSAADAAMTDGEISAAGVDAIAYDLGVAINLLQEVTKLVNGQATAQSNAYRPTVNKWRQV